MSARLSSFSGIELYNMHRRTPLEQWESWLKHGQWSAFCISRDTSPDLCQAGGIVQWPSLYSACVRSFPLNPCSALPSSELQSRHALIRLWSNTLLLFESVNKGLAKRKFRWDYTCSLKLKGDFQIPCCTFVFFTNPPLFFFLHCNFVLQITP